MAPCFLKEAVKSRDGAVKAAQSARRIVGWFYSVWRLWRRRICEHTSKGIDESACPVL